MDQDYQASHGKEDGARNTTYALKVENGYRILRKTTFPTRGACAEVTSYAVFVGGKCTKKNDNRRMSEGAFGGRSLGYRAISVTALEHHFPAQGRPSRPRAATMPPP